MVTIGECLLFPLPAPFPPFSSPPLLDAFEPNPTGTLDPGLLYSFFNTVSLFGVLTILFLRGVMDKMVGDGRLIPLLEVEAERRPEEERAGDEFGLVPILFTPEGVSRPRVLFSLFLFPSLEFSDPSMDVFPSGDS